MKKVRDRLATILNTLQAATQPELSESDRCPWVMQLGHEVAQALTRAKEEVPQLWSLGCILFILLSGRHPKVPRPACRRPRR